MTQTNSLVGQIDLLALPGAKMQDVDGLDCIVIPKKFNPSIFSGKGKNGSDKAYLDLVIRESPDNQFGNTHFIKANVGRSNRERLGISREELPKYTPILGNFRPFELAPQEQKAETTKEESIELDLTEAFEGF